jgi:hypothetical protein
MDAPESAPESQQTFRFVLPRLYTLSPDVVGQVFPSRLGAHPIDVRVPESPRHAVQPSGGSKPGSGVQWVVPRSLELAGPASIDLESPNIHAQLRAWWRCATDWLAAWLGAPPGADIPLERLTLPIDDGASDVGGVSRGVMQFYGYDRETHATGAELARASSSLAETLSCRPRTSSWCALSRPTRSEICGSLSSRRAERRRSLRSGGSNGPSVSSIGARTTSFAQSRAEPGGLGARTKRSTNSACHQDLLGPPPKNWRTYAIVLSTPVNPRQTMPWGAH